MNRILALVTTGLVALGVQTGQIKEQKMNQNEGALQELQRIEESLPEAMMRGDVALVERITADDFLGFDPNGQEIHKADLLARMKSPDYELQSLRHEDIRVRVFGDCAVATARTVVRGRYKGQETGGQFRYLRVWVRRGGRWQAVAAQSATLPEP